MKLTHWEDMEGRCPNCHASEVKSIGADVDYGEFLKCRVCKICWLKVWDGEIIYIRNKEHPNPPTVNLANRGRIIRTLDGEEYWDYSGGGTWGRDD